MRGIDPAATKGRERDASPLPANAGIRTSPGSNGLQGPDAPLAHRSPGHVILDRGPLDCCVPAEPDSASPGTLTVPRLDTGRNHSWISEPCLGKSHPSR